MDSRIVGRPDFIRDTRKKLSLENLYGNDLPTLAASPLNNAAWDAWATAWEAARASLPRANRDRLDIPLRLLRTGIAWLKTKDEAELLALPREERRILREALGLSTESQE